MRLLGIPNTKLPTKFEVSSSSSFGDMFDRLPEIVGSRDLRHAHFHGKLFVRPLGIPDTKLHTKFGRKQIWSKAGDSHYIMYVNALDNALARVNIPTALFGVDVAVETSHLLIDSYYNAVLSCVTNCCVGKRPRNFIIKFPLGSAPHSA